MKIGFIGFGEAAFNMAIGLKAEGLSEIYAYDVMANDLHIGRIIKENANESDVTLLPDIVQLVELVDIVISAVPSRYAMGVCSDIKQHLKKGQFYVDVSASTAQTKEEIYDSLKDKHINFVDAAMMGSLPKYKHQVPISASGNGAERFKNIMEPYNMKIEVVSRKAGDASAIKLIRSIFMKGLSTLMIEMLQAADAYGVSVEVVDSIAGSMDNISFSSHLDRLVIGSAIHCKRRADELEGSIEMLEGKGIRYDMTEAAKKRLHFLEQYNIFEKSVEKNYTKWEEIIEVLNEERRKEPCQ